MSAALLTGLRAQSGVITAVRPRVATIIGEAFSDAQRGDTDIDQAAIRVLTHYVVGWIGADTPPFPPDEGYDLNASSTSQGNSYSISLSLDNADFNLRIND